MKKRLASLVVVLILAVTLTAHAIVPLVPGVAYLVGAELAPAVSASLIIHGAAGAALLISHMRPRSEATTKVDSSAVQRPANVTWVDLKDVPLPSPDKPEKKTANVNAKVPFDAIRQIAGMADTGTPKKYPALHDALKTNVAKTASIDSKVGDHVELSGVTYKVDSITTSYTSSAGNAGTAPKLATAPLRIITFGAAGSYNGNNYYCLVKYLYVHSEAAPWVDKDDAGYQKALTGEEHPNGELPLSTAFQDDIDKLIHDNPNIVHYETEDKQPISLDEFHALDRAAADKFATEYQKYITAKDAADKAAQGSETLTEIATNAQQKADQAAAAAAGDPSNSNLQLIAQQAQAAANAATAAAVQAQNQAATAAAALAQASGSGSGTGTSGDGTGSGEEDEAAPIPASEERKELDFGPLRDLKGALDTTYPFNLPSSVKSYFEELTGGTGEAPVFVLPLPLGQSITADLSVMEPVARIVRFLVGLAVVSGLLFYIFHFFRGIS